MASKHASESLAYCMQVGYGGAKLPSCTRMITGLAEDAKPLIWNEGCGQLMLTCHQNDVADAPPAVKLILPSPRPVVASPLQEEPYSRRWVALSRYQASPPNDRKPNLDLPTVDQGTTQGRCDVMDSILGWKGKTPTTALYCGLGRHPRRVVLATDDGSDLPACRIERDRPRGGRRHSARRQDRAAEQKPAPV